MRIHSSDYKLNLKLIGKTLQVNATGVQIIAGTRAILSCDGNNRLEKVTFDGRAVFENINCASNKARVSLYEGYSDEGEIISKTVKLRESENWGIEFTGTYLVPDVINKLYTGGQTLLENNNKLPEFEGVYKFTPR